MRVRLWPTSERVYVEWYVHWMGVWSILIYLISYKQEWLVYTVHVAVSTQNINADLFSKYDLDIY